MAELRVCPHCGSTVWLADIDTCSGCGLSYAQADRRDRLNRRHAEHARRARLVVDATRLLPMRERIRVAKHLLLELATLPSGEVWDREFQRWRDDAR